MPRPVKYFVEEHRRLWEEAGIPYGECLCGCGNKTRISEKGSTKDCWVKGEPQRYIYGHSPGAAKPVRYLEEDRGHETPCWIWQLKLSSDGYGRTTKHYQSVQAHRVYYEEQIGPIPPGFHLDHLCRQRSCVNPAHLEAVTPLENVHRQSSTKLTATSAAAIRRSSSRSVDLAARYGVSEATICDVRKRRKWVA